MSAGRAGTVAVASVVASALLLVVLAAWASSIGPGGVLRGDGPPSAATPTLIESSSSATADPGEPLAADGHTGTPRWVRVAAFLINVAVTVGAVYLLARYVVLPLAGGVRLRRVRRAARRRRGEEDLGFAVVEPPEAMAREMLADAAEQRRVLVDDGSPRNAVVACWHRFETQGAAAGLERRTWETSSEYTLRVLDLVEAHEPAVVRLAALYREARFSEHDLTEEDRRVALEALDAIHRTIGARP
jgi:hypothetical protein